MKYLGTTGIKARIMYWVSIIGIEKFQTLKIIDFKDDIFNF